MIYLDEIGLENFQSHKKTVIKIDKGVTVIHGISGHGKTAILRGAGLLVNNRPSGAKFYSNFAPDNGETVIYFHFSDGKTIFLTKKVKRGKDRKKTLAATIYEAEGTEYQSGKDVPEGIKNYLNIGEVNIQKQFAAPFLIFSSPGEVARTINRITQLDEADGWKSDLTKRINKKKTEIDILNAQAKEKEQELVRYRGFEDLEDRVKDLENVDFSYQQNLQQKGRLDQGLEKIEFATKRIENLHPLALKLTHIVADIELKDREIEIFQEQKDSIGRLLLIEESLTDLADIQETLKKTEAILEVEVERDGLKDGLVMVERSGKVVERLKSGVGVLTKLEAIFLAEDQRNTLLKGLESIKRLGNDIIILNDRLVEKKEGYIEVVKRDKTCPICFKPIDDETIKLIEREL